MKWKDILNLLLIALVLFGFGLLMGYAIWGG